MGKTAFLLKGVQGLEGEDMLPADCPPLDKNRKMV
jgi:hypothetical protein